MKKVIFIVIVAIFVNVNTSLGKPTSDDPVLLRINEREITLSEFEYVYTKNNLNPQVMDPRSVEEYLDLFINFNLKVYEALQLRMDTNPAFISELEGYRKQLAQPYLTDQTATNQLIEEAYQRLQFDIRASHILINVDKYAPPRDTLAAWNKAMEVRRRILKGENFETLAREFSDDPSAKGMPASANRPAMRGNGGDIGYFSALDMVYPFETAAYSLAVNEISMPVRTQFGYHIIKVTDRLPAMGRARVAHIMIMFTPDSSNEEQVAAKEKIEEIYKKILDGEEFQALAQRYSDDKASGRRGGEMPAFTSNRMVPEFIKAIAQLSEPGQISKPLQTQYGWHIIYFFEKQLPPEDAARAELKSRIGRDNRAEVSQQAVVQRLKNGSGFSQNLQNLEIFFEIVDNSIFDGRWDKTSLGNRNLPLFRFSGIVFTQADFANHLAANQTMRTPEPIRNYVMSSFENYVESSILAYEETKLPEKYPEFRRIMNEYHDGILLFELTDQRVWSRAIQDTVGLTMFYQQNMQNYIWEDRMDATIYTFNDELSAKNGRKLIRRAARKKTPPNELLANLNQDSPLAVTVDKGLLEVKEYPALALVKPKKGISKVTPVNNRFVVVVVNEFLPRQPKKLNEIRGLVIADYQNYLEEQWISELKNKYPVVVYKDVLNQLFRD